MESALQFCKVLIVDDTKTNVQILVQALRDEYKLGVATSGAQALAYVEQHRPDLVLLDIMMPEMDGYEVCQRLKADPHTRHIPVVFITALDEVQDKTRGFELGAVDYITKPFEIVEVQARVRTHLQLEQYRRDLAERNQALEEAGKYLQHQVRELEGCDRLMRAQMSLASLAQAGEEILAVAAQVLGAEKAALYQYDNVGEFLKRSHCSGGEDPQMPLVISQPEMPVAQACATGELQQIAAGEVVVPLIDGDRSLGALWMRGMATEVDAETTRATLKRLAGEAVLVLNSAKMAAELERGELQVDELFEIGLDET